MLDALRRTAFAIAVTSALAACSTEADTTEPAGSNEPAVNEGTRDEVHFDVKWKPDTTVLDEKAVSSAWKREASKPEEGRYVFGDAPALARMKEGGIVLLPKLGLFKVKTLAKADGTITITTDVASLLDAATEGDISWRVDAMGHTDITALQKSPAGTVGTRSLKPLGGPQASTEAIDMTLEGGGYLMGVKMSRTKAGERDAFAFEILGSVETEEAGATVSASAELKGTVSFKSDGAFKFKDDKVLQFDFHARDIVLDATGSLEVDSLTVRGELVDYPARIIVPFTVGPIPMYNAFGAAVDISGSIGTGQKAKVTGTIQYEGDVGFEGNGLSVSKVTKTGTPKFTGSLEQSVRGQATVVATLAAPRIELGMGVPQLGEFGASAGVFVDMRASLGARLEMSSESGTCMEALGALGAYYGGEAKLFGLSLGTEKPIVKFSDMLVQNGKCPE